LEWVILVLAITNFGAPFLLFLGWQGVAKVYAICYFVILLFVFYIFSKDDPFTQHRRLYGGSKSI
jgi:hypothetical protein